MENSYTHEDCRVILRKWLCDQFGEDPEKYPLTPDIDRTTCLTRSGPEPTLKETAMVSTISADLVQSENARLAQALQR